MFWNKFVDLCVDSGKSPTPVCTELGFSSAVVVKWKRGAIPRDTTLKKLADYFGVPMSYFTEKDTHEETDEVTAYLEELKNRPEMKMLFSVAKGATKEDIEKAVAIIEALKKTNNG